jgi:hypothetical protein
LIYYTLNGTYASVAYGNQKYEYFYFIFNYYKNSGLPGWQVLSIYPKILNRNPTILPIISGELYI